MRYEHLELDFSTVGCAALQKAVESYLHTNSCGQPATAELIGLANELRARLQRRDIDPHCAKNFIDPLLA